MTVIVGDTTGPPVHAQRDHTKQLTFFFPEDWSGSSWFFRVSRYDGATLEVNRVATSASYASGTNLTKVLFDLTAIDMDMTWSVGRYSVTNNTQDRVFLHGPFLVGWAPD